MKRNKPKSTQWYFFILESVDLFVFELLESCIIYSLKKDNKNILQK